MANKPTADDSSTVQIDNQTISVDSPEAKTFRRKFGITEADEQHDDPSMAWAKRLADYADSDTVTEAMQKAGDYPADAVALTRESTTDAVATARDTIGGDSNQSRRSFLRRSAGAMLGAGVLSGVATQNASARKLPNAVVEEMVSWDYYVWNNGSVPTKYLRELYHPLFHKHETRFGGPTMKGVAMLLSNGIRDSVTLLEYRRMIEIVRPTTRHANGNKLIEPKDNQWVRQENPRSGGGWVFSGEFSATGKPFRQDAWGSHTWKAGKPWRIYIEGMSFASFLRQVM